MQIEGAREAQRSLRWAPIFKRDVHLARKRTTPKHRCELPLPSYLMRGAIEGGATGGAQWHSVAIRWHSVATRGNPWHSAATSGQQRRTASKMALKTTRLERLSDESDSKAVNRSRARPVNAGPPEAHAWRAAPKSTCAKGATRGHQGGHQGGHQTQIRRHSAHLIRLHAARKHLIP